MDHTGSRWARQARETPRHTLCQSMFPQSYTANFSPFPADSSRYLQCTLPLAPSPQTWMMTARPHEGRTSRGHTGVGKCTARLIGPRTEFGFPHHDARPSQL